MCKLICKEWEHGRETRCIIHWETSSCILAMSACQCWFNTAPVLWRNSVRDTLVAWRVTYLISHEWWFEDIMPMWNWRWSFYLCIYLSCFSQEMAELLVARIKSSTSLSQWRLAYCCVLIRNTRNMCCKEIPKRESFREPTWRNSLFLLQMFSVHTWSICRSKEGHCCPVGKTSTSLASHK